MGIQQIFLQQEEFDELFYHLSTHLGGKYKNMHLRISDQVPNGIVNGRRKTRAKLRYIHLVHIKENGVLEGAISGKGVDAVYTIERDEVCRVDFSRFKVEDNNIESKLFSEFVPSLLDRSRKERNPIGKPIFKTIPGKFYIKRWSPGTSFTSEVTQQALASGAFSRTFLEKLEPWNFLLYCP